MPKRYLNKEAQNCNALTQLLHLMKLSFKEIESYEATMRNNNNGMLTPEVAHEIRQNIKRHNEDFGKGGIIRNIILKNTCN